MATSPVQLRPPASSPSTLAVARTRYRHREPTLDTNGHPLTKITRVAQHASREVSAGVASADLDLPACYYHCRHARLHTGDPQPTPTRKNFVMSRFGIVNLAAACQAAARRTTWETLPESLVPQGRSHKRRRCGRRNSTLAFCSARPPPQRHKGGQEGAFYDIAPFLENRIPASTLIRGPEDV